MAEGKKLSIESFVDLVSKTADQKFTPVKIDVDSSVTSNSDNSKQIMARYGFSNCFARDIAGFYDNGEEVEDPFEIALEHLRSFNLDVRHLNGEVYANPSRG